MRKTSEWLRVIVILSIGLWPASSMAHTPGRLRSNAPFVVANPQDSYALFGVFYAGDEVFVAQLRHATRFAAPVEMLVPHTDALKAHRPAYAVVGIGLPMPTADERALLPKPLPNGWGAVIEFNDISPRPALFESVMRRFYCSSEPLAVIFPQGDSEIWIWSPAKTKGKFGLGFGVEEGGGYLAALKDWSLYAY
ncbi:MAG: hypothetical protein KBG15_16160 [Kofleriaceae bacterium]|nr:hypothetical protein [Kofleriaceae bacterium]